MFRWFKTPPEGHGNMPPSPAPKIDADTCIMYLVRHGATANNLANPPLLQGRGVDLELSAAGRQQAACTAELLASQDLVAIYSSPLIRARQTAKIIAEPHGLEVQLVSAIEEVDVGQWEGRSWQEISQTEPEPFRQFVADSANHGYRGGENMTQVLNRSAPVLDALMQQHLGAAITVIAHNVVNRVYVASLLGIPISRAREINQDNCGVNVIRFRRHETKVLTLNAAFHLR
ncbi:MAG TPA: histidine phosphatase family protein [Pirellulaceae bacterium]|nr:histidine phosphatase family protein [Pirellulaceae bacterium]